MDLPDLQGLPDQAFGLDLMTWRTPVGFPLMDFPVSEGYRVLLDYLDTQVNLASRV